MIEKKPESYIRYSPDADSARRLINSCTLAFTPDDAPHYRIVTARLWHAAVGLAKCVALGVDGTKAYTTVA